MTNQLVFLYVAPIANAVGKGIVDLNVLDTALFFTGCYRPDIFAEIAGSELSLNFALTASFFAALAKAESQNRMHFFTSLGVDWPASLKRFLVERGHYISDRHAAALQQVEDGDYHSVLPTDRTFHAFGVNSDFSNLSTSITN